MRQAAVVGVDADDLLRPLDAAAAVGDVAAVVAVGRRRTRPDDDVPPP